jgi:hypothetical protein
MQSVITTRVFWLRTTAGLAAIAVLLFMYVHAVLFLSNAIVDHPGKFLASILAFAAFAAIAVAVLRKPVLGVYLFAATFPLANWNFELAFVTVSPPNVLLLITALGWMAQIAFPGPAGRRLPHGLPSRLLWIGWMLVATVVSISIAPNSGATGRFLVTRIGYFLTFLLTFLLVDDLDKFRRVIRFAIFSASVSSAVAIAGAFLGFPNWLARSVTPKLALLGTLRTSAFDVSPHSFAGWLLFALAATLMSVANPGLWGLRRKHAIGLSCLFLMGILISQARGAWVALVATALVAAVMHLIPSQRGGLARPLYIVGGIVLGAAVGILLFVFVVQPIIAVRVDTVSHRLEEYRFAITMLQGHLLFGVGPLDERILGTLALGLPVVDNAFLIEAASTGLFGFIPFLVFWITSLRSAGQLFRDPSDHPIFFAGKTLFFSLVLQLVAVQAYVAIGEKAPWFTMGLTASVAAIAYRESGRNGEGGAFPAEVSL